MARRRHFIVRLGTLLFRDVFFCFRCIEQTHSNLGLCIEGIDQALFNGSEFDLMRERDRGDESRSRMEVPQAVPDLAGLLTYSTFPPLGTLWP